ncbi:hypothetical protein RFM98_25040 [Mesorhizobium sp. VK9D]|uniref:hypothetical protein n=1 Tax=Mesorhizobium australafricanum TaxID=3072311 RepID=UPI002A24970A|nr:hypothetical protein [Mesorhizobium sp. VK9D]MDX8456002.1 hypothetical protein [Mesorhizobium sp. VK9D]
MAIYDLGFIHLESVILAANHVDQAAVAAVNKYLLAGTAATIDSASGATKFSPGQWAEFNSHLDEDASAIGRGKHDAAQPADRGFQPLHLDAHHQGQLATSTHAHGSFGQPLVAHGTGLEGKAGGPPPDPAHTVNAAGFGDGTGLLLHDILHPGTGTNESGAHIVSQGHLADVYGPARPGGDAARQSAIEASKPLAGKVGEAHGLTRSSIDAVISDQHSGTIATHTGATPFSDADRSLIVQSPDFHLVHVHL